MVHRALAPLVAGILGSLGALGATFQIYRAADDALVRVLESRLRGAGEAAAAMLRPGNVSAGALQGVMRASRLEGVVLLSADLRVVADATGAAGGRADLLRIDAARVSSAFRGLPSVDFGFAVGEQGRRHPRCRKTQAARLLGVTRRRLYSLLENIVRSEGADKEAE